MKKPGKKGWSVSDGKLLRVFGWTLRKRKGRRDKGPSSLRKKRKKGVARVARGDAMAESCVNIPITFESANKLEIKDCDVIASMLYRVAVVPVRSTWWW